MGEGRSPDAVVVELTAEQTYELRRRVLRVDTPSTRVDWPGDDLPTTFHLGIVEQPATDPVTVRAVSTWLGSPSPDVEPSCVGLQLRGMATDPIVRGQGFGAALLVAGIERARRSGADHIWANARSSVLDFYASWGFTVTSDEFTTLDTAIAHRRILLRLSALTESQRSG